MAAGDRGRPREWFDSLQEGDLILWGKNRTPRRIVRLTHAKDGRITGMYFKILRCSWTRRPYTVYGRPEIRANGHKPPRRIQMPYTWVDAGIEEQLDNNKQGKFWDRNLYCWDVV